MVIGVVEVVAVVGLVVGVVFGVVGVVGVVVDVVGVVADVVGIVVWLAFLQADISDRVAIMPVPTVTPMRLRTSLREKSVGRMEALRRAVRFEISDIIRLQII